MKFFLLPLLLFISGCVTTAPVKHALPEPPQMLAERCPELKIAPEGEERLSELIKVIIFNYTLYHECGAKHELLVKWYNEQKQIHDSVFNKK